MAIEENQTTKKKRTRRSSVKKSVPADPFVGKVLGNCRIKEKIAEGGTSFIYLADNTNFNLNRVVKILKPALVYHEEFFKNFKQEAQLTARLDHPNILRVFDTGEFEGHFFIEMEYFEGQTLREYLLGKRRLLEQEALAIIRQVVEALDYAHNNDITAPSGEIIKGILHRDIKPENIMIDKQHNVRLMDFGAAKPLNLTSDTNQQLVVGTMHYMSPEQMAGEKLDVRSDFFSLGIVLYELISGKRPFTGSNLIELIESVKRTKHKTLRKTRPSVSPLTDELVEWLLSRKKVHRPDNTIKIKKQVNICISSFASWSAGQKARIPRSLRRFIPTLSLLLSLAAFAMSGLALWQSTGAPAPSGPKQAWSDENISLLEKGKSLESRKKWREAVRMYQTVMPLNEGGRANEYLEAQIRVAYISFKHLNQFTKARAILEKLRLQFSDPAIDAYLGEIYYRQALYPEAVERLNAALSSKTGSVIPPTDELKSHLLYTSAYALDKHYIYVNRDPATLMKAVKAWKTYIRFTGCLQDSLKADCETALKRRKFLEQ